MRRVVSALLAAGLLAAVPPAPASGITPDELRQLVQEDSAIGQARAARAKTGDPGALMPASPIAAGPPRPVRPTGNAHTAGRNVLPPASPDLAAPGEQNAAAPIFSDAVPIDSAHIFGIRLGTWMHARLAQDISSAEPDLAELVLTRSVAGDHRRLPAGTLLFARTVFNGATRRLELGVEKGITPRGREFQLKGLVFDTRRTAGLQGIVAANMAGAVRRGTARGMLAAGGAALNTVFGDSGPGGAAAGATVTSILGTAGTTVDESAQPAVTIYVKAQPVLIRVEATF